MSTKTPNISNPMTILNLILSLAFVGSFSITGWWLSNSSLTSWISLSGYLTLFFSQAESASGTALKGYQPLLLSLSFSFSSITFTVISCLGLSFSAKPRNKGMTISVFFIPFSSYYFWRWLSFSFWLSLSSLLFLMFSSIGLLTLLKVCLSYPPYSLEGVGENLGLVSMEPYRFSFSASSLLIITLKLRFM